MNMVVDNDTKKVPGLLSPDLWLSKTQQPAPGAGDAFYRSLSVMFSPIWIWSIHG